MRDIIELWPLFSGLALLAVAWGEARIRIVHLHERQIEIEQQIRAQNRRGDDLRVELGQDRTQVSRQLEGIRVELAELKTELRVRGEVR